MFINNVDVDCTKKNTILILYSNASKEVLTLGLECNALIA